MTEEEKEVVDYFKKEIDMFQESIKGFKDNIDDESWRKKVTGEIKHDILMRKTALNLLSKKDKIINLMATELSMFIVYNSNPKQIIEKFYKKVEEENANNKN